MTHSFVLVLQGTLLTLRLPIVDGPSVVVACHQLPALLANRKMLFNEVKQFFGALLAVVAYIYQWEVR